MEDLPCFAALHPERKSYGRPTPLLGPLQA
jgi:hypothetical protein